MGSVTCLLSRITKEGAGLFRLTGLISKNGSIILFSYPLLMLLKYSGFSIFFQFMMLEPNLKILYCFRKFFLSGMIGNTSSIWSFPSLILFRLFLNSFQVLDSFRSFQHKNLQKHTLCLEIFFSLFIFISTVKTFKENI